MTGKAGNELSRRERQVMDIVYARGRASVAEVQVQLLDSPSYSATRMLLQRLQKKGLLGFERDGARYLYFATTPKNKAAKTAWNRLVNTFFEGSAGSAASALLGDASVSLSIEELDELERLIEQAKAQRK